MSITDIVDALSNPCSAWRTLCGIEPLCHNGRPIYVTGNAAVNFTVKHEGVLKMLKCYTHTNPNLKAIYGERFYPRELCVISFTGEKNWVDCLLYDRIEGRTLDEVICTTFCQEEFKKLATTFDIMAYDLLSGDIAHGDIKPENIVVSEDGKMTLIDFDSAFLPSMAGTSSPEIGTAAYQHPRRTVTLFNRHIDDYSIATISTLLHATAENLDIADHFRQTYEPIFLPHDTFSGKASALDDIREVFARQGNAVRYRIASMLYSPYPQLVNLHRTLSFTQQENLSLEGATLEQEGGLWGCRGTDGWIIPPLYDDGFEPIDGLMVLYLAGYAHILSLQSRTSIYSFDKGVTVKPLANRHFAIRYPGADREIVELDILLQNSAK